MTSAERGSTVTMIGAINAGGGFIPPLLIFPRVNYKDFMITNAPPGTIGGANPSGRSNENLFFQFMEHFIKHVRPSTNAPCIVLFDNHESHMSVPVIDLAKRNGITLVTFHPHTSHKLQPIDKGVFGPFKKYYSTATNEMMLTPGYVGKPITIYNVASLVGKAFPLAFTPNNIMQGFKATGIYPFNENIFDDSDYLSAQVTDRPYDVTSDKTEDTNTAANSDILPQLATEAEISSQSVAEADISSQSVPEADTPSTSAVKNIITPSMIRPHPKAAPRKNNGRGRQKGKSRILTDTPEKIRIEMLKMASLIKQKKRKTNVKVSQQNSTKCKNKKKSVKRKIVSDSESSISDDNFSLQESDMSEMSFEIYDNEIENTNSNSEILKFQLGDFVIFVYGNNYFPGKIVDIKEQEFVIASMENR
ncbi:uncharacterized protein LOC126886851 [Diabrotica virgifera virgifera]|uniref:DDE-1 domain-containing protein n=1 Tax=Diabrotica virgifera virgifera TaxID=50390 RepID=A0ABM5KI68_DIAVI|nr:uncharacterized protein LOC126886851 [Diabrotica virgifera virgifera]